MTDIEQKKAELKELKEAKMDILQGRVHKFHKGDTSYTMLNFKDLCLCIKELEAEIAVIEQTPMGGLCQEV